MADGPKWDFLEMRKADMNADPVHDEFFNTEALDSLSAALVRESNQNTLDARDGDIVRVRIVFGSGPWQLNAGDAAPYLKGLWPHLEAPGSGLREDAVSKRGDPMPYLAIEDFGTRGLLGDPAQYMVEAGGNGKRNDFFYFWRNLGRSRKTETDRGRWGLGHTVFAASSRINAFLGITVRNDDHRILLMGQSILRIHRIDGKQFVPYGFFGMIDSESFALPVENHPLVERFCQDFRLNRLGKPGLSVVIPYADVSVDHDSVARSLVTHYFYPIIKGSLEAELVSPGGSMVLDRKSLRGSAQKLFASRPPELQSLNRVFDLIEWAAEVPDNGWVVANDLPPGKAPTWDNVSFRPEDLVRLREQYEHKKRLAIRLPLRIQERKQPPKTSHFQIFLEREASQDRGELLFVRQDITVANPKVQPERGVRAVVVIDDGPLATFLGDAENPAHTEWQERSAKFKDKYEHGVYTLRFVKNSVHGVIRMLTAANEEKDKDLLRDLFFVTRTAAEEETSGDTGKGPKRKKPTKPEIPSGLPKTPPPVRIDRVATGFRVYGNPEALPRTRLITVVAAYAVRNGNPFKRYLPEDFDFGTGEVTVDASGAQILEQSANRLVFSSSDPSFSVRVTGFDEHRDIEIRVTHEEVDQ